METSKTEIRFEKGWTVFDVKVKLKLGLCARPSSQLVLLCSKYPRQIHIERKDNPVPPQPHSKLPGIMGLLMLAAGQNTVLSCRIEGEDEAAAKIAAEIIDFLSRDDDY